MATSNNTYVFGTATVAKKKPKTKTGSDLQNKVSSATAKPFKAGAELSGSV